VDPLAHHRQRLIQARRCDRAIARKRHQVARPRSDISNLPILDVQLDAIAITQRFARHRRDLAVVLDLAHAS
jgi:hypothetical protein